VTGRYQAQVWPAGLGKRSLFGERDPRHQPPRSCNCDATLPITRATSYPWESQVYRRSQDAPTAEGTLKPPRPDEDPRAHTETLSTARLCSQADMKPSKQHMVDRYTAANKTSGHGKRAEVDWQGTQLHPIAGGGSRPPGASGTHKRPRVGIGDAKHHRNGNVEHEK